MVPASNGKEVKWFISAWVPAQRPYGSLTLNGNFFHARLRTRGIQAAACAQEVRAHSTNLVSDRHRAVQHSQRDVLPVIRPGGGQDLGGHLDAQDKNITGMYKGCRGDRPCAFGRSFAQETTSQSQWRCRTRAGQSQGCTSTFGSCHCVSTSGDPQLASVNSEDRSESETGEKMLWRTNLQRSR